MLLMDRVYHNIPTFFKRLLIDFIISIIYLNYLLLHPFLSKAKSIGLVVYQIISWIIIIWPRIHLWEFEWLGRRFSINNSTGIIHLSPYIIFITSSLEMKPIQNHKNGCSFMNTLKLLYVKVIISNDSSLIIFKHPIYLKRDVSPIDVFHLLSEHLLLLDCY